MFTVWHRLFSLVLTVLGLIIEASSLYTVQGKCIYNIFKAENQETKIPLLYTKPSINSFHLSKVGNPEVNLSTIHA